MANARIGAFLNMIGLPLDAITYITTAPPGVTLPITPAIARNLGIEVYEQHGMETDYPGRGANRPCHGPKRPSWWASSASARSCCNWTPARCGRQEATLEEAHEASGVSGWGRSSAGWRRRSAPTSSTMASRSGALRRPVRLRAEGLSFGFDGPSFDCSKASSATEHLVCDDPKSLGAGSGDLGALFPSSRTGDGRLEGCA